MEFLRAIPDIRLRLHSSALELITTLTNPVIDPIGVSLYQNTKAATDYLMESKLIAQKNFGPLIVAYNATLEAVWDGDDLEEREASCFQSLGASYEFAPRISAGIELVHEFVFPRWRERRDDQKFLVGPNVSFAADIGLSLSLVWRRRQAPRTSPTFKSAPFSESAFSYEEIGDFRERRVLQFCRLRIDKLHAAARYFTDGDCGRSATCRSGNLARGPWAFRFALH